MESKGGSARQQAQLHVIRLISSLIGHKPCACSLGFAERQGVKAHIQLAKTRAAFICGSVRMQVQHDFKMYFVRYTHKM